jgi:hypothetical protein
MPNLLGCARYPSQRTSDDQMKRTLFLARSHSPSVVRQLDSFTSSPGGGSVLGGNEHEFLCQDPFQLLGGWRCRLGSWEYDIHEVNVEP